MLSQLIDNEFAFGSDGGSDLFGSESHFAFASPNNDLDAPSDNLVLRTSDDDEIYTSICLDQNHVPMCKDCRECEGGPKHSDHREHAKRSEHMKRTKHDESGTSELQRLQEQVRTLHESNSQLRGMVASSAIKPPLSSTTATTLPFSSEPTPTRMGGLAHERGVSTARVHATAAANSSSSRKSPKSNRKEDLPVLPYALPHHQFRVENASDPMPSARAGTWFRFVETQENLVPVSCWIVRSQGRADHWTLLECNQAFLDLIDSPQPLTSAFSVMDLVPQRFKSSTSELLQQIIHSHVDTASAKSIWKQGSTEMCVNTYYRIYRTAAKASSPGDRPCSSHAGHRDETRGISHYNKVQSYAASDHSLCETTGCGAFNKNWSAQRSAISSHHGAGDALGGSPDTGCADTTCISHSERDGDRIIWMSHEQVDYYDDYIRIGNKIHEQTFSIQVSIILSLVTNSTSASLRLKSRRADPL